MGIEVDFAGCSEEGRGRGGGEGGGLTWLQAGAGVARGGLGVLSRKPRALAKTLQLLLNVCCQVARLEGAHLLITPVAGTSRPAWQRL